MFELLAVVAMVGVGVPILADLLCLLGITVSFRPRWAVLRQPLTTYHWVRAGLGLVLLLTAASVILNVGWLRILFGLAILVHFVVFRWASGVHLKARQGPSSVWFVVAWVTFVFGYGLLPDFGDTEDSVRVFFSLVRPGAVVDVLLGASVALLVANLVMVVVLLVQSRATSVAESPTKAEY